ncbi:hypothetical protein ZIOFF_016604 [Zingiber officinale]|uniref:Malectin-like domain-containing protein n=1 Tax=Zingiber officinale TaxID=94328 RepID=A0A8J5I2U2_ZINOF|nr:hypothetical protein ZIOFF_016604 [Zingiber officinale]
MLTPRPDLDLVLEQICILQSAAGQRAQLETLFCSAMAIAHRKKMDSRVWWPFLLIFVTASAGARAQSTDSLSFLSIDCGLEPGSSYVDPLNISYVSDSGFIDTGVNRNISDAYLSDVRSQKLRTLRAFPNGTRNCYTIGSPAVAQGSKYLLRAWFFYGNYDGLSSQLQSFELHLGVNYWDRVNVTTAESLYWTETITVATAGYLSVCLVNLGTGTPFISGIDLRQLKDNLYPAVNESQSLVLFNRWNLGEEFDYVRWYPYDPIDRVWDLWNSSEWNWNDTAVTPINSSRIVLAWDPIPGYVNQFFPILHISEIFDLSGTNQSRQFNIYVNGFLVYIMTPPYLYSDAVYSLGPLPSFPTYNISLEALSNSTLPPILNAFELYMTMSNTSVPSDAGDGQRAHKESQPTGRAGAWRALVRGKHCILFRLELTLTESTDPLDFLSIDCADSSSVYPLTNISDAGFIDTTAPSPLITWARLQIPLAPLLSRLPQQHSQSRAELHGL